MKKKINSYLTFELYNEFFAIHVKKIISIIEMKNITKIPETTDEMLGIIDIRGEAIPVIDSHIKLNMPPIKINTKTSIIILDIKKDKNERLKIGFMVDKVIEVLQIRQKDIIDPPNYGSAQNLDFISGVYLNSNNDFIMILDIDKTLYGCININISKEIDQIKRGTEIMTTGEDSDNDMQ